MGAAKIVTEPVVNKNRKFQAEQLGRSWSVTVLVEPGVVGFVIEK